MDNLEQQATEVGQRLLQQERKLATAESCTGGWIAQAITSVAGSSMWFERGFVTYSNEAKQSCLGVNAETLDEEGAVSERTAIEMADGALRKSEADVAISVTGIAGPGGGTKNKPVGTVWIGIAQFGAASYAKHHQFSGDRASVRQQAVEAALRMLA